MVQTGQADTRPYIDYMARDYDSLLQAMRDLIPQVLPEWRDFTNEADFGNVLLELFAHMGDILSYYQDRVAEESFLATARTRRSVIEHLRLIGYELGTAAPAGTALRVSVPATVKDTVTINPGDAFATSSTPDRPAIRFEYLGPAALTIDFAGVKPDSGNRRVYDGTDGRGIPVTEGRLWQNELVAHSDGSPNQRVPLSHPQVILGPPGPPSQDLADLSVVTVTAGAVSVWTRRDTLAFSQSGRLDYMVEIDADDRATLVFGDGEFGGIPPRQAEIRATYRVGGGRAGNVPPEAITTIVKSPDLARLGAQVFNSGPATGGADREDAGRAARRAPAVFRSTRRAVTAADYEALALSFGGVGKVRAVPNGWNEVKLLVAPEGGGTVSDVLEAGLIAYFEDKRMVGQIVTVGGVKPVPIMVTAAVTVESFAVREDVLARAQQAAAGLLDFDSVDLGQTVHLSRYYDSIQDVPGVVSLVVTEFRRADRALPLVETSGTIRLEPDELPVVPSDPDYAGGFKDGSDTHRSH